MGLVGDGILRPKCVRRGHESAGTAVALPILLERRSGKITQNYDGRSPGSHRAALYDQRCRNSQIAMVNVDEMPSGYRRISNSIL